MKKLWFGLLATLLLTIFVAPAFAWDFSMTGEFEWRFRYFGRANGYQDLFGDMRLQENPIGFPAGTGPIGFAGPNFYRGYNGNTAAPMATGYWGNQVRIVRGGFSYADSDAFAHDQRMTFLPEIRINNAVRLRGVFDLASIRQKYNHRDYGPMGRWTDGIRTGQAQTRSHRDDTKFQPVARFSSIALGYSATGTRDFAWGPGAALALNTRNDSLLFVFPYGPFRIIPQVWLANGVDGYGLIAPYTAGGGPAANSVVNYDGGTHYPVWWSVVMTYDNGPMSAGWGFLQRTWHLGRANMAGSLNGSGIDGLAGGIIPGYQQNPLAAVPGNIYRFSGLDQALVVYTVWLKYNNGHFFANMEYDWFTADHTFVPTPTSQIGPPFGGISGAPPLYLEGSLAFLEAGALCGPAKLGLMFAWSGGSALNNGNITKSYTGIAINNQPTDPYNYLLFHTYGGGNNGPWQSGLAFMSDENGQMVDAWALAARLDYAVAANLNIWGWKDGPVEEKKTAYWPVRGIGMAIPPRA